jgi:hypothetical protein
MLWGWINDCIDKSRGRLSHEQALALNSLDIEGLVVRQFPGDSPCDVVPDWMDISLNGKYIGTAYGNKFSPAPDKELKGIDQAGQVIEMIRKAYLRL